MRRLPVLPSALGSASKLALAAHCLHPFTAFAAMPEGESGAAAEKGHVVHRGGELAAMGAAVDAVALTAGLEKGDRESAELMIGRVVDLIAEEQEAGWLHLAEIVTAYDIETDTGRVLRSGGQRDYSERRPSEIPGTVDVVRGGPGRIPRVRDLKTGRQKGRVPVGENWQLRTLGLAVARILGVDEVEIELVYVDEDRLWSDVATMGPWELEEHAERLFDLVVGMAHGPTPPNPGPWCVESYCPARFVCPATRGALAAIVHEAPLTALRDNAEAARAVAFYERAKVALAGLHQEIKEFARREPIALDDGNIFAWRERERRSLVVETPEQMAAVASVLGPYASLAITTSTLFETSIAAIKRGARAKLAAEGKKRGLAELEEAAISALAEAGGVKVSRWEAAEAFKMAESSDEAAE